MRREYAIALVALVLGAFGCEKPQNYDTTVEIVHVQRFGDGKTPGLVDLELRFTDCGADARRLVRLDKTFSQCASNLKTGDKVPATLTHSWNAEKGSYRSEFSKIASCAAKADPKDEANYELVQVCSDLQATGAVVGVHCDRTRPKELLAKCPFLRRK
ncbi:MAG: hypothetical protein U0174_13010 [Polyangiaceae bacterium]